MRTIFVLLAVLAGLAAFAMPPQEDGVIPEMEFFQSDDDELGAAETVAVMRKKGATDSDCLKVAEDSFEMVKGDVKTAQDAIDKAINGASKCNDKGASEIAEAKKEQKKQKDKVVSQTKELTAHKNAIHKATVEASFGDIESSLQSKVSAASYLKDSLLKSFDAAKLKVSDLNKKLGVSKGKAQEADKLVTKAEEKAKNAKKDCQCKSYKAYQDAVEAAKNAADRQSKDWTKAQAIECAVKGLTGSKCRTTSPPKVDFKVDPFKGTREACEKEVKEKKEAKNKKEVKEKKEVKRMTRRRRYSFGQNPEDVLVKKRWACNKRCRRLSSSLKRRQCYKRCRRCSHPRFAGHKCKHI